jgi:spore coat protein U-like protein
MRRPPWLASFGLGALMLLLGSGSAQAQFGNCSITTTPVAFGGYDVFDSLPLDSTGNIHITCFGWLRAASVWLSKGNGPSTLERRLVNPQVTSGRNWLTYNLYMDAGHTQIWGDPNPYSFNTTVRFFFMDVSLDIYGRIDSEQDVQAGTYTDAILVSINF